MKLKARQVARRGYSQTTRAQSAEDTGRRIIDAFLERLMNQWFDEITLDSVAGDADVTVQTVIRRFGGKDGLLAEAVTILASQINAQRGKPSDNIDELIDRLYCDYERTGDSVVRLLALEPRHPAIQQVAALGRREHREWVTRALAKPLSKLVPAARTGAIDALIVATDVYSWKLLRRDMSRSVPAAKAITTSLVHGLIKQF
ncbi:hypothetical protein BH10PLA1_BH10PLA1_16100 [soil metagenome]